MRAFRKGFTIIEVVLVLAIAGLIFLMVFIALPALQRSQRNTQRKDDMARVITAVNDYQKHNNGKSPFEGEITQEKLETFVTRYIDSECTGNSNDSSWMSRGVWTKFSSCGSEFTDPDGTPYSLHYLCRLYDNGCLASNDPVSGFIGYEQTNDKTNRTFYFFINAKCSEEEGYVSRGKGDRNFAMYMLGEGGYISCMDNSD